MEVAQSKENYLLLIMPYGNVILFMKLIHGY